MIDYQGFELFAESEDSNPGGVTLNGFQDRRNRPLYSPPQRYKKNSTFKKIKLKY